MEVNSQRIIITFFLASRREIRANCFKLKTILHYTLDGVTGKDI